MYAAFVVAMICLAALIAITRVSRHRVVTFLICAWILASPVFDAHFATIPLGRLSFDLRMERLLLIALSLYVLLRWTLGRRMYADLTNAPRWVYAGLVYLGLLALVDVIHLSHELSLREFVINLSIEGTFFVVLLVVAVTANDRMAKVITQSLIVVCVISSAIAIFQFFIDPQFFRYGVERPAFAGFVRANGVFASDHTQAYWLIAAVNAVLLTVRGRAARIALVSLFVVGLVLTFHRMSWIVFAVLMLMYWGRVRKVGFVTWWSAATVVVGLVFVLPATDVVASFARTAFVRERLTQDTGSYRMLFTVIAVSSVPDHPIIGVGSVKSSAYYARVRQEGLSEEEALGEYGGIHNSYLQLAYLKGVPVALAFLGFLLLAMKDLWRLTPQGSAYGYLELTEVLKFALGGLTNGLVLGSRIGILMAILLGVAVAMTQGRRIAPKVVR